MSDDRQLIALCRDGCVDSFGKLMLRYQARLFAGMYRCLGNAEDARDVVQDTFLLAFQSLGQFQGRSDFFTWLYRIGVNAAAGFRRKQRPAMSIDLCTGGQDMACADLSPYSEPTYALVCAEQATRFWQIVDRLPSRDRKLLVLKELEGLHYDELAKHLRVPIGTIRSRLHRARMKLRLLLEGHEYVD